MPIGPRQGRKVLVAVLIAILVPVAPLLSGLAGAAPEEKVDPSLLSLPEGEVVEFWVTLPAQPDLSAAVAVEDWAARGDLVVDKLRDTADDSQEGVVELLESRGVAYEPFWISNTVRVTATRELAEELGARPDVEKVLADRTFELPQPIPATDVAPEAVEWNVASIRAPEVWSTFATRGEGIVIANIDTGVQFDHPALVGQYRGNTGGAPDHNYNWFDPSRICGNPSLVPCDNNGHGTHTMGTMVGQDGQLGVNLIGVAPGARWIAAKGCESNYCSLTALLSSGEWLLAPTDLNGQNPRPDLRPNVVNNSWGGGGGDPFFQDIVSSWVASGIFPAFANGNRGPGCASSGSPGDYASSYSAGAYGSGGVIASFSSRGASSSGGLKPDIAAPGVNVRSSVPLGLYSSFSGTSMASPHVAATVALMWSAAPGVVSDVAFTRQLLDQTAVDTTDLTCGGTPADNNVWGEGRLDAFAAVELSPRGPSGTLEVSVTRAGSGVPVSGAGVQTLGPITRSIITDSAGQLSLTLPIGTYQVNVGGFGFLGSQAEVVITEGAIMASDHALEAMARHVLSGTVVDDAGTPVAGAQIALTGTPVPPATTDVDGAFSVGDVPGGEYDLVADGSDCLAGGSQTVAVTGDTTVDLTLARRVDAFGYSCRAVAPDYIEADTVLPLVGDDAALSVPMPFPFSFYGTSYGTAHVSTNGFVSFVAQSTRYDNAPVPNAATPNGAIFAFWDDLIVSGNPSSVRTRALGSEPDRRFVIEWRNVAFYGDASRRVDFEVVLHQNGRIETFYRSMADDDRERGGSATIGLENAAGTAGFSYSFQQPSLATPSSGLRFDTAATLTNVAPDAVDDSATTVRNAPATISLLANDSDPEGQPLSVTAVSDPARGTATVNPDMTVAYVPDLAFEGPDSFTYDVADGDGGADRATVSVVVGSVNSPPVAQDDVSVVLEDTPASIAVLANDSDPEGEPLSVGAVSDPPHGSVTVNPDSSISYQPDTDFTGADSFTYDARDPSTGADTATVSVTVSPVNDPPMALEDAASTAEDTAVRISVLANDSDVDGDPLDVTGSSDPPQGSTTINPDRTITYQPDPDFNGPDSFAYDVSDGRGGMHQATVTITVDPAPPVTPQTAVSVWTYPSAQMLRGVGQWLVPVNEPVASPGQVPPSYQYSNLFWFSDLRGAAIVTLGAGARKYASFIVTRPDGTVGYAEVPFPWTAGRAYFMLAAHVGAGQWRAWVIDGTSGAWTLIGTLSASAQHQQAYPVGVTYAAWSGAPSNECADFPPAQVLMLAPTAYVGATTMTGVSVPLAPSEADCPAVNLAGPGWVYYGLGFP